MVFIRGETIDLVMHALYFRGIEEICLKTKLKKLMLIDSKLK